MKSILLIPILGLAMLTGVGGVAAAEKPNFSGEWRMNPAKTNYGGYSGPASYRRAITHIGENVTIVDEQSGGAADGTNTRTITTDGKPVALDVNGTPTIATATWAGNALIANTAVPSYGVEFKDRMSLSDDGKELTSVVEVTSVQGNVEFTIVFDRQ